MSERFFLGRPWQEPGAGDADQVRLTGAEARHLAQVVRGRIGDQVVLFDGTGREIQARITAVARGEIVLNVLSSAQVDRELPWEISLAVALPKGDRQRWLVEKATELGVTRLIPLKTDRGVAQPTDSALARLARYVVEASKQCGRNRLMAIEPPQSLAELRPHDRGCLADPSGRPFGDLPLPKPAERTFVVVGPEGGFTDAEVATARDAGFEIVSLGPRILRVETAALTMAARWIG